MIEDSLTCKNPTADIIVVKQFFLSNWESITTYSTLYWCPSYCIKARKRYKDINIKKRNKIVKSSLFINNKTKYVGNAKESTGNLLALIRKFKEAAGYKKQCTKPTAFLYTNKSS